MTSEQKQKIADLRLQGSSYAEIADATGISLSAVKTHCWRHKIAPPTAERQTIIPTGFCQNCGKTVVIEAKKKPKKFCCDKCRETWWNRNRKSSGKSICSALCAHCGAGFSKYIYSKQRYCCHACYISARFGEVDCHGD